MEKDTPAPTDDLEEAEEKSGSVDERIPEALPPKEGLDDSGGLGPGELVLEHERKAVRAKTQPG